MNRRLRAEHSESETMGHMQKISPADAKKLIDNGAVLVDIREGDERARAHIANSEHLPLSRLDTAPKRDMQPGKIVVFHCKGGNRTALNAAKLQDKTPCETFILDGGIDAWSAAGLPIVVDKKQPIEIFRQIMIVAGALVLSGVGLGLAFSSYWFFLSAFVGGGLMFSGLTGYCLMAYVLRHMPWNKGYA